jgi:sec-independent protein translocase protein TatA
MGPVGIREILLIVLVIVILFGARRIPELMKGMGQGIREFKHGMKESDEEPKERVEDRSKDRSNSPRS